MVASLVLSSGGAHFPHMVNMAGYVTPYKSRHEV